MIPILREKQEDQGSATILELTKMRVFPLAIQSGSYEEETEHELSLLNSKATAKIDLQISADVRDRSRASPCRRSLLCHHRQMVASQM